MANKDNHSEKELMNSIKALSFASDMMEEAINNKGKGLEEEYSEQIIESHISDAESALKVIKRATEYKEKGDTN